MAETLSICGNYTKNCSTNNGSDSGGNNCEELDRLSALPDVLLVEILSLLPLNNAAATSALSRRWVPVWTQLPILVFNDYFGEIPRFNHITNYFRKYFHDYVTTFNHILRQLTSPNMHTFDLTFYHPRLNIDQCRVFSASLVSWIPLFCSRNPSNLKVSISQFNEEFIPLPTCIFETSSLVNLELCWPRSPLSLPECVNVNLPNLKSLSLTGFDFYLQVLTTLFKSCPLLHTLFLKFNLEDDQLIDISAPSLKSLTIEMGGSSHGSKFMIDAPLLEVIRMEDCIALYSFVKIPCNLQKAEIIFCSPVEVVVHLTTNLWDLFRGISKARSIDIGSNLAIFNSLNPKDANIWSLFCNLTHLEFETPGHGNWGAKIPSCLLIKLKSIKLTLMKKGDDDDAESIKFILGNANVLEKLHIITSISIDESKESMVPKEYNFCKNLLIFPRISLTCKIEFDGWYVHVFGDSFQDGGSIVTLR